MASQCAVAGRIDDFRRYCQAGLDAIESGRYDDVPDAMDATLHAGYMMADPVWCAERCRTLIAREPESRPFTRQSLVFALTIAGLADEAIAATDGLLAAAEATDNPHLRSGGLLAYGFAYRDADPATAYDVHRRGLAIAHESGNQQVETIHAVSLARIAATHRDPVEAFEYLTLSIRNYYDSGNFYIMSAPLVVLAVLLGRLGHHESAATIAGFVVDSDASAVYPEITSTIAHLRDVLGDDHYKSCARTGQAMSNAAHGDLRLRADRPCARTTESPGGCAMNAGCALGGRHIPVHRYRGVDPAVGGRRRTRCASALAAHDDGLREAIQAHDGWLFKHTGDGVCAVFASPRAAVDCRRRRTARLELPVRMGLATGEAELRDGDYFGAVLNRAARVMAAGHGGQILLDGTTADLLTGFDLIALGPRRLRDIVKPVHIWQVRADGLLAEFPPLRTLDATPGNLRLPPTSFIGRDAELAELETVLKEHRLVTLTGVGGVGKTRLALELAARSASAFPDGVWVIELAAIGDPAVVPEAVAAVLGITQQPGMSLADSIAAALEGRVRLLVFDNCEHVLDAAADMIEAILARSKTVKVLATSREGLRIADEQLWPVPSLDVQSSASMLFVERASAVAPSTSLVEYSDAVAEICLRLDGIPLAIELAASRLLSMTVVEIRDHLDDRFRLLVGSRRGLERHQTLRHAVQWSYELLDAEERAMLNRCSVFAGGFDAEGAQAVAKSRDKFATLDLLDALVRKSLVTADQSFGRTRFSMLETIRQFAEEQLVADGEAESRAPPTRGSSPARKPLSWPSGTVPANARRIRG